MAQLEYVDENSFKKELIEFNDDLVKMAQIMYDALPNIISIDKFKSHPISYGSIMVCKDKKSLQFGINLAKNRVDRETGKDLYIVKLSKFKD